MSFINKMWMVICKACVCACVIREDVVILSSDLENTKTFGAS